MSIITLVKAERTWQSEGLSTENFGGLQGLPSIANWWHLSAKVLCQFDAPFLVACSTEYSWFSLNLIARSLWRYTSFQKCNHCFTETLQIKKKGLTFQRQTEKNHEDDMIWATIGKRDVTKDERSLFSSLVRRMVAHSPTWWDWSNSTARRKKECHYGTAKSLLVGRNPQTKVHTSHRKKF